MYKHSGQLATFSLLRKGFFNESNYCKGKERYFHQHKESRGYY